MKREGHLLLSLICAVQLAGCGDSPSERFGRARTEFASHDFAGARQDLILALQDEPADKAMLELLAQTLLRLNDPEGAQNAVERLKAAGLQGPRLARLEAETALLFGKADEALALIGREDSGEAWRIRAAAWLRKEETGSAIGAFEKGLLAEDNVRLLADYAEFMLAHGDGKGASRLLQRLRAQAPGSFETLMIGGRVAASEGQVESAASLFAQAGKAAPKRHEPLLARAEMLERQGKPEAALKLVAQAKEMAPKDAGVKAMQLRLLAVKGDWGKVRDMLQTKESSLDPRSADAMTYGEALLNLGHAEQARALFSRTVLLAPENRYARMMLGRSQLATGDPVAALNTLEPLTQGLLSSAEELELNEHAAREAGDEETADALLARQQSPEFGKTAALAAQGEQAMMRGDWMGVADSYRRLLPYGEDAMVLKRLAYASSMTARHEEAIAFADRARAHAPSDPEMLHMAGLVRLKAGKELAEAVRLLRQALAARPANEEFQAHLAQAEAAAGEIPAAALRKRPGG